MWPISALEWKICMVPIGPTCICPRPCPILCACPSGPARMHTHARGNVSEPATPCHKLFFRPILAVLTKLRMRCVCACTCISDSLQCQLILNMYSPLEQTSLNSYGVKSCPKLCACEGFCLLYAFHNFQFCHNSSIFILEKCGRPVGDFF